MESQQELNRKIVLTTIKIQESYPELTKYLNEMPACLPFTARVGVNNKELEDYLDSLNQLLETFSRKYYIIYYI